jgi:hypothetical protein
MLSGFFAFQTFTFQPPTTQLAAPKLAVPVSGGLL